VSELAVSGEPRSALDDFLERACVHERMGGFMSPFLLQASLLADLALLGLIGLGSLLHGQGIKQLEFFLFGGGAVGDLVEFLQALTWPMFRENGV